MDGGSLWSKLCMYCGYHRVFICVTCIGAGHDEIGVRKNGQPSAKIENLEIYAALKRENWSQTAEAATNQAVYQVGDAQSIECWFNEASYSLFVWLEPTKPGTTNFRSSTQFCVK